MNNSSKSVLIYSHLSPINFAEYFYHEISCFPWIPVIHISLCE
jgi:hypothetical protein